MFADKTLIQKPLIYNPVGQRFLIFMQIRQQKTEDGNALFLGAKILTKGAPYIRSSSCEALFLIAIIVPRREPIWDNT